MCEVAGFSRAGYYRRCNPAPPSGRDMAVRDEIQKIALDYPSYGSRRIAKELDDGGHRANRKRVQRIMREDNLLCVTKRKFVVTTRLGPRFDRVPECRRRTGDHRLRNKWPCPCAGAG